MIAWEIEKDKVVTCILQGAKRIEKDGVLGDKIVSRYKEFEVVFKQRPCNYFIITIYLRT
jgi:YgiT-type zinc finger domain-containing protein